MKKLTVNVGDGYDILIESGLLKKAGSLIKIVISSKRIALISDTNVSPLYLDGVKTSLEEQGYEVFTYIFKAGEESKNTSVVIDIVEFLAKCGLDRLDTVVALGGGVCGDMAGFAAAIYLRGIKYIQIPTTLLSQVDSSVGGKTAVDLPQGKNLCGAFHQPSMVIIDPDVLSTLDDYYFSDGMGEVIKYGCIKSASLFELLEKENAKDFIDDIIYECLDIKRQVVENDEKEHGERALLNFGHTCGHAIEKLWNFKNISHGAAVAVGMVMITEAAENNGFTEKGTKDRLVKVIEKNNLPIADSYSFADIVGAMSADKKRAGDEIKLVLLNKIGESFIMPVNAKKLNEFFSV
ncbi:MAG: 3-dehydroquinate synthase [Clostridiales bacterium]|nr:3-dehydroquinate synthase [Clostridiales bacterium]